MSLDRVHDANSSTNSGYAEPDADPALIPWEFERRAVWPRDVSIDILSCGVCHSDILAHGVAMYAGGMKPLDASHGSARRSVVSPSAIWSALEPGIDNSQLAFNRLALGDSLTGSIAETQEILDFCAANGIVSEVEPISIDRINEAFETCPRRQGAVSVCDRHEHAGHHGGPVIDIRWLAFCAQVGACSATTSRRHC